jgi:hypothetical protein
MIFKITLTVLALLLVATFVFSLTEGAELSTQIICGAAAGIGVFIDICEWVQPKFMRMK